MICNENLLRCKRICYESIRNTSKHLLICIVVLHVLSPIYIGTVLYICWKPRWTSYLSDFFFWGGCFFLCFFWGGVLFEPQTDQIKVHLALRFYDDTFSVDKKSNITVKWRRKPIRWYKCVGLGQSNNRIWPHTWHRRYVRSCRYLVVIESLEGMIYHKYVLDRDDTITYGAIALSFVGENWNWSIS